MGRVARAATERQHLHVQAFIEQKLDGALGGIRPGVVGIEIDHHRIGVPVHGPDLRVGQGGTATGDHFLDSRRIDSHHIHVAFDQHRAIGLTHGIAGAVKVIQGGGLAIDGCFGEFKYLG